MGAVARKPLGHWAQGLSAVAERFWKESDAMHALLIKRADELNWLRHAHGSHALDRGATLAEVQTTLGHANVATTSGYLHARPNTSSGLKLDEGIFR